MVPPILSIHQQFLDELRRRLEIWEPLQRVGDAFVQVVWNLTFFDEFWRNRLIPSFLLSFCSFVCILRSSQHRPYLKHVRSFYPSFNRETFYISVSLFLSLMMQISFNFSKKTDTLFVNNVSRAKGSIRTMCNQRPAFARFLENMAREHKGKLTLDNLLIKPVQKFPK